MFVRSIGGLMTSACITSNMHWPKVLKTLAPFLHDFKRMTFKWFPITIWFKNVTKWIPKWALNGPQNRPQNGPKLDLCLKPFPETPGGPKPYKTSEKHPRETSGARRTESAKCRVAIYLKCEFVLEPFWQCPLLSLLSFLLIISFTHRTHTLILYVHQCTDVVTCIHMIGWLTCISLKTHIRIQSRTRVWMCKVMPTLASFAHDVTRMSPPIHTFQ